MFEVYSDDDDTTAGGGSEYKDVVADEIAAFKVEKNPDNLSVM